MKKYLYIILFFLVCVPAIAGTINSYTLKSPPDDTDTIVIYDSADGSTKKIQVGDISGGSGGSVAAGWTKGGTEVYLTTSSDSVAIGTTTPATPTTKLTISGDVSTTGSISSTGTQSYTEYSELSADPDIPPTGKGRLFQRDDNHVYYIDDTGTVTDLVSVGAATEWTTLSNNIYNSVLTDNVSIGTSVAGGKLTVKSPDTTGVTQSFVQLPNGSTTAMTLLDEPSAGKPRLRMRNSASPSSILIQLDTNGNSFINTGNVGIGTTIPVAQLNVTSPTFPPALIERTTSATDSMSGAMKLKNKSTGVGTDGLGVGMSFFLQDSSNTDNEIGSIGYVRRGADDTGDFSIRPATSGTPTERMIVRADGNVGIGTATPREVLDVIGTVRASGYKSSDGTAGVTGSTCTAWKNGLCTSL